MKKSKLIIALYLAVTGCAFVVLGGCRNRVVQGTAYCEVLNAEIVVLRLPRQFDVFVGDGRLSSHKDFPGDVMKNLGECSGRVLRPVSECSISESGVFDKRGKRGVVVCLDRSEESSAGATIRSVMFADGRASITREYKVIRDGERWKITSEKVLSES